MVIQMNCLRQSVGKCKREKVRRTVFLRWTPTLVWTLPTETSQVSHSKYLRKIPSCNEKGQEKRKTIMKQHQSLLHNEAPQSSGGRFNRDLSYLQEGHSPSLQPHLAFLPHLRKKKDNNANNLKKLTCKIPRREIGVENKAIARNTYQGRTQAQGTSPLTVKITLPQQVRHKLLANPWTEHPWVSGRQQLMTPVL